MRAANLLLIGFLGIAGCGQVYQQSSSQVGSGDDIATGIFANRPIQSRPEIVTVVLSNPALLTVGKKTARGWYIPVSAKQNLLHEQEAVIAQVASADPTAKVLYRYRLVLNALTFVGSSNLPQALQTIAGVQQVEVSGKFQRPNDALSVSTGSAPLLTPTSVDYIGADLAHKRGLDGTGVRVGIIDTGIDYTHAMLGGPGTAAAYKSIDPAQPTALFPNKKVVGGTDLAGSDYDAASELPSRYIPHPDANPLDEAGHGSHVAGTIAGIGDGVNTYSGVAPNAQLYAIKVFGKKGSTSDATILAALEYAANPSGDLNPDDQLDAVNLSLGGDFGTPHILYGVAIHNLSQAGTVVVAAAGNSGQVDFVVGAPGTVDDAISVAASIDGGPINWKFASSLITTPKQTFFVRATEGPASKPVAASDGIQGRLVYIGYADQAISPEVKAALQGQVAFIMRGKNSFAKKLQFAKANGAVGAVVVNNQTGDPIPMGLLPDESAVDIPAIMISFTDAKKIVADNPNNTAVASVIFKTANIIQLPELIDTIASFSSKGPRSEDDLIKPEISAPGQNILSAAMGQGSQGVRMNGTSMATPHITGTVALLKQAFPNLSVVDLKGLLMNNALQLHDPGKVDYPISTQGAGRVQIQAALAAIAVATPSLSLGLVQNSTSQSITKTLHVTNLTDKDESFQLSFNGSPYLSMSGPKNLKVAPNESQDIPLIFLIHGLDPNAQIEELDGHVILQASDGSQRLEIPAMAMRVEISNLQQTALQTSGATSTLSLKNTGAMPGDALVFNLLGEGKPKTTTNATDSWKSTACNLKSAGYRFVTKKNSAGEDSLFLQFGYQLYQPLTSWNYCELNVQFDLDGDGVADLELAGISAGVVTGLQAAQFASYLLDAAQTRQIRSQFEDKIRQALNATQPNYAPALLSTGDMAAYSPSTIAMSEVEVSALGAKTSAVRIKVAVLHDDPSDSDEPDDFLTEDWQTLSLDPGAQSFQGMPEVVSLDPLASGSYTLTRGSDGGDLVVYFPANSSDTGAVVSR